MSEDDLSQQSFWSHIRECRNGEHRVDLYVVCICLGLFFFLLVLYSYFPFLGTLAECIYVVTACLVGVAWGMVACFRWIRGEPQPDIALLLTRVKIPLISRLDRIQPRANPNDFIENPTSFNRSILPLVRYHQSSRREPLDGTNTESNAIGVSAYRKCNCRKSSKAEASASTGGNLSPANSDPTDDGSSSKGNMEMVALNPQQEQSPTQKPADSEKCTCN